MVVVAAAVVVVVVAAMATAATIVVSAAAAAAAAATTTQSRRFAVVAQISAIRRLAVRSLRVHCLRACRSFAAMGYDRSKGRNGNGLDEACRYL